VNAATLRGRLAVLVFACFAGAYFMSFALRTINAVIAPELVREFSLSHSELGSLSSAYFLAFSLLQLPLGIWLDRFGSRRVNASLLLVAAAGCATFALAQDLWMLWTGRALIGAGVAGALMSALKGYRFWYAPQRQYQLTAWMLVAGTAGALSVTVPAQLLLQAIGWRGLFWAAAALLLASSAALWTMLPRDEEQAARASSAGESSAGGALAGYGEVFRSAYFWRFGIASVLSQSTFIALQSLWAGPWFIEVLGMTPQQSAQALFVFNLTLMLGFFAFGWALPGMQRRGWSFVRISAAGLGLFVLAQLAIATAEGRWAWTLWLVLAIASTCFSAMQTHVSLSFRAALTGRAYTAYNLIVFVAIFVNQWLFGVGVDLFRSLGQDAPGAFRATLLAWTLLQVAGLALLVRSKASAQQPAAA